MIRTIACVVLLAAVVGCGEQERESSAIDTRQVSATVLDSDDSPIVEFNVPDMMCPDGCGVAVEGILSKQPGAKEVMIDFEGKTAKVLVEGKFDPDKALADLVDKQFSNSSIKTVGGDKLVTEETRLQ